MLEETEDFGLIFSPWVSLAGCILWTGIWVSSHCLLPGDPRVTEPWSHPDGRSPGTTMVDEPCKSSESMRLFYMKKLHRMFIYCSVASVAGMSMFTSCFFKEQPTQCMLMSFGPVQQFFFWMAVGHWITALWEDWRTRYFLGQGLTKKSGGGLALFPLNLCCSSAQVMYVTYTVHHVMTLLAYLYSLCSYQLGGVMVQGLLFELPVLWMLRREMGYISRPKAQWLTEVRRTHAHHGATYLTFLLGRGPAECLWIVSMLPTSFGNELLEESLSLQSTVVYHTLAAFFTSLNLRILGLLFCWHEQDVSQARLEEENREVRTDKAIPRQISKE